MASNVRETRVKAAKAQGLSREKNARGEGERLRAEIVDAAVLVLSNLGGEDPFSLRAVARTAGIAAPSVYLHFADRDALLLAVLEKLFSEQIAFRAAAEEAAAGDGGGPWDRLLARSLAAVEYGLRSPGHFRVLFEGRVMLRLDDPRVADFGRPLLARSVELITAIKRYPANARGRHDAERLALLLWAGLHGVVSLRINKPTIDWPAAGLLAEEMTRAVIQPE